jgi:high affinity Mn2+ porin
MAKMSTIGADHSLPSTFWPKAFLRVIPAVLLATPLATGCAQSAFAQSEAAPNTQAEAGPEKFALHGQFTYVEQETSGFNAPYSGPNSLSPNSGRETTDATIYLGAALWHGAEGWIDGEVDQGFGLNDTLGVAGFPSAEAYKIGKNKPYLRLPRLFIRDTIDLDGTREAVDSVANQLGGDRSVNRWIITLGKISVGDIFDVNQYAHDPRGDFLNWTAVDAGTFDYAADAWGYTVGAAAERYQGAWTLRGGAFDLSNIPNSPHLDPGFHEFQLLGEIEHRHEVDGHSGKLMLTLFDSRGRMGLLDQALALAEATGTPVNIAAVRQYRSRLGVDFNLQQELTADLGLFTRAGKAAGNVEVYEFTDVDRSLSAGLSLKGSAWRRADDTVGLAIMDNGISGEREQYLNAGGLGILVGDGKLPHPGPEGILETYYNAAVLPHTQITFDYQWIDHPAYNRDRGPVSVFAVRLHAQF